MFLTFTVYPKKYAHGFCFAMLCCGYTLTDFPISIRLTSLALWQSNDCPSASKATLMNMDKHFMWLHYERLHNHNKAKHNKTVCIYTVGYTVISVSASCRHATGMSARCDDINYQSGWLENSRQKWTIRFGNGTQFSIRKLRSIMRNMTCHRDIGMLWW